MDVQGFFSSISGLDEFAQATAEGTDKAGNLGPEMQAKKDKEAKAEYGAYAKSMKSKGRASNQLTAQGPLTTPQNPSPASRQLLGS